MGSLLSYETQQIECENKHVWGYCGRFDNPEWIRKCNNCNYTEKTSLISAFNIKSELERGLESADPLIRKIY